jgi:hypothetical protein
MRLVVPPLDVGRFSRTSLRFHVVVSDNVTTALSEDHDCKFEICLRP